MENKVEHSNEPKPIANDDTLKTLELKSSFFKDFLDRDGFQGVCAFRAGGRRLG
jgi:hypothetical protein